MSQQEGEFFYMPLEDQIALKIWYLVRVFALCFFKLFLNLSSHLRWEICLSHNGSTVDVAAFKLFLSEFFLGF